MSELTKETMASVPDKHTIAWWNDQFEKVAKGYRGATHAMNLVLAEIEDQNAAIVSIKEEFASLAEEVTAANVAIGKLQEEITLLKEALDKSREAYSHLKQIVSQK